MLTLRLNPFGALCETAHAAYAPYERLAPFDRGDVSQVLGGQTVGVKQVE
jgi:hypothetical protein